MISGFKLRFSFKTIGGEGCSIDTYDWRFEFQFPHSNLTLATDQRWPLNCLHISYSNYERRHQTFWVFKLFMSNISKNPSDFFFIEVRKTITLNVYYSFQSMLLTKMLYWKWQQFWKKWESCSCLLKMNAL